MEILEELNKADIKKEETKGFKTPAKDIKKEDTKGIKTPAEKKIQQEIQDETNSKKKILPRLSNLGNSV